MSSDYYIFKSGRLKRKDNTLYFLDCEGNKKALPVELVDKIHVYGEIDFNTKLINYLSEYGLMLNFYNYYGYYAGTFYPRKKNISGFLVTKQAKHYLDFEKRIYLAKCFVDSAKHHILRNLRRYKDITQPIVENIEKEDITSAKDISELMGVEGRIRNWYYKAFNGILKNGFTMDKREKRPPIDPVNVLISFGNSLMYTLVLGEIYKTQLDPSISYLHEPSTKRFSLSLDLAEIFKPMIVDPIIFGMINKKAIALSDFSSVDGICLLREEGRKRFITEFEEKLSTTVRHRKLNRNVSYKGFIRLECYKLIKYFLGDEVYSPLKAWW